MLLHFYFIKDFKLNWNIIINDFRQFSIVSKLTFFVILISSAFKCAQVPFILDNESYYIQTIKWLNEYGFVKGLANLNIAFGQTSGWHILQSGFNFSFISNRFNDLNGFILIICAFCYLNIFSYEYRKSKIYHWSIFILVFNVLTFQFINSPSPDLPIFLIGQLIFIYFLKNEITTNEIKIVIFIFLSLCFVKITIAPIGLLIFYLVYQFQFCSLFELMLQYYLKILIVLNLKNQ